MKKVKAEFHHKKADSTDASDAWVVCNKPGHKTQYYLSCSREGILTVGPDADATVGETVLPNCDIWDAATKTPICDGEQLGIYNTNEGATCRKDNCYRYCDGDTTKDRKKRTTKKIKCICDWATEDCGYFTKINGNPGWHLFKDEN